MSFEQVVKVPLERVGVLVGKQGLVKKKIEASCGVILVIDSASGDVTLKGAASPTDMEPFKAVNVVTAISRGFSPERAFKLFDDDVLLEVMDLREYVGKSENALARVRGRIIGLDGKSRRLIEELTGAYVSVYGRTVAIIGLVEETRLARDAVDSIAKGSTHNTVYKKLEKARTQAKLERMKLWEEGGLGK